MVNKCCNDVKLATLTNQPIQDLVVRGCDRGRDRGREGYHALGLKPKSRMYLYKKIS